MNSAGRPPKTVVDMTKIAAPRLITVYRLNYPGYEQVTQYYKYNFNPDATDDSIYVEQCPGCGKNLKYAANEHRCSGTLLPMPVDNKTVALRPRPKTSAQREQLFRHYLTSLNHPVQVSE